MTKKFQDSSEEVSGGAPETAREARALPFKVRAGQREFERGVELHRICGLVARRQYGKTTIASRISLKKMMKRSNHTVIFGSVKLDLGREIVRKEAEAMQKAFAVLARQALAAKTLLDVVNEADGKSVATVNVDDWSDLYEAQRLEFRLYHSRSVYSRTKVVALTPEAVGETGDLILDEVGRARKFRDVWEAMGPIIASNPEFRAIFTTTPPPDDTHYSFELLSPPIGTEMPVNPQGNWYRSELGVWVLRITAFDAYADGISLYDDDTGAAIDPLTARKRAHDKDAWDRNYGCRFVLGGTAACGSLQLDTARERGVDRCGFFVIDEDVDLTAAIEFMLQVIGDGPVGIGVDVATTTKETSNPTSLTVSEQISAEIAERLVLIWKTNDPAVAHDRIRRVVVAVRQRKAGGAARRLCIDGTNERYFATELRRKLGSEVPVEIVIASETVEIPGEDKPVTLKQKLGSDYVAELNDNHLTLPPERYVKEDHRLVKKEKGQFVCEPDADGKHGDTFDSGKLSLKALRSIAGAITSVEGIVIGRAHPRVNFRPRRLLKGAMV